MQKRLRHDRVEFTAASLMGIIEIKFSGNVKFAAPRVRVKRVKYIRYIVFNNISRQYKSTIVGARRQEMFKGIGSSILIECRTDVCITQNVSTPGYPIDIPIEQGTHLVELEAPAQLKQQ